VHPPTEARYAPYSAVTPGAAGPSLVEAAVGHERLIELTIEAAPRELLLRALGAALARTSRQLGTLERLVAPALRERIRGISATLDEREREDQVRARMRRA